MPATTREDAELCLGGSFNPIHHGHLIVARAAAEAAGCARVRLMVAGAPPHKPGDISIAAAEHRVAMARQAVGDDPGFVVDDRETRRDEPSYTAATAESLMSEGRGPVRWLIGADLVAGLPRWHRAEELLADPPRLVQFLVMRRPGDTLDWPALPPIVRHLEQHQVETPAIDLSATLIRRRIAEGREIRYLVPEAVRSYIETHRLYRSGH